MCTWSLPFEVYDECSCDSIADDTNNSILINNILKKVLEGIPEELGYPVFFTNLAYWCLEKDEAKRPTFE